MWFQILASVAKLPINPTDLYVPANDDKPRLNMDSITCKTGFGVTAANPLRILTGLKNHADKNAARNILTKEHPHVETAANPGIRLCFQFGS